MMTYSELANKLIDYFLGDEWYSIYSNSEDVNDDAYRQIIGSYKSIYNKNPILDYRIRHPKCRFCKYYKSCIIPAFPEVTSQECTLKDKNIYHPDMPRICKYYCVKLDI